MMRNAPAVLRAAIVSREAAPGAILQQIYVLSEQARAAAERDVLRAHQLDMRVWLVLRTLDQLQCATQREIAVASELDKVAVNRAASWLKGRNLVTALQNTQDGRSHLLKLSPEGIELLASCERAVADLESEMMAGLTEGEGWQAVKMLQHLHRSLLFRLSERSPSALLAPAE
jgi:DNA-binding MarR family transcriptional regulator